MSHHIFCLLPLLLLLLNIVTMISRYNLLFRHVAVVHAIRVRSKKKPFTKTKRYQIDVNFVRYRRAARFTKKRRNDTRVRLCFPCNLKCHLEGDVIPPPVHPNGVLELGKCDLGLRQEILVRAPVGNLLPFLPPMQMAEKGGRERQKGGGRGIFKISLSYLVSALSHGNKCSENSFILSSTSAICHGSQRAPE